MNNSNNPGVGGRGKRAPYKTTHYRMPIALKPIVEEMARKYRELVDEYEVDDPALVEAVINAICPKQTNKNIDSEKIELAIEILNSALTLKANSGGAIKRKVEEALKLMNP
jgi:hypothetical protein